MASDTIEITHRDNGDSGEYRAELEGSDEVARLTWKARGEDVRVADHTLVPNAFRGRGIAGKLVDALIADAREHKFKIVPQCSYVEAKFDENPEWADLRA